MQRLVLSTAFCGALVLAAAAASIGNEPPNQSPMLSHLKVGQVVKLERATSGGYNVNILNAQYIKSYERANHVPPKIADVGPDYIVVKLDRGIQQMIAVHAIDVITLFPAVEESTEETKDEGASEE